MTSSTITPASPTPPQAPSPVSSQDASHGTVLGAGSRVRQAAAYVGMLVWGVPLAAFVVAAVHADASPCVAAGEIPCDEQGVVVLTAVLAATLLIPVGLLAMLLVAVLATTLPTRAPAMLAVLASASVALLAAAVWGVVSLVTS